MPRVSDPPARAATRDFAGSARRRGEGRPSASGPRRGVAVRLGDVRRHDGNSTASIRALAAADDDGRRGLARRPRYSPAGGLYFVASPFLRSNTPGLSLVREIPDLEPAEDLGDLAAAARRAHGLLVAFGEARDDVEVLSALRALEFVDGHGAIVRRESGAVEPGATRPRPALRQARWRARMR